MSTRGLIGFVHNGEVHAGFNSHSSYLASLGQEIVEFCDLVLDWDTFIKNYVAITWTDEIENETIENLEGVKLLRHIHKGEVRTLLDEKDFAEDDLFCEYAYLLNLDKKELEIYSHTIKTNHAQEERNLPMNLLARYPLDEIPTHWREYIELRGKEIERDWRAGLGDNGHDHSPDLDL